MSIEIVINASREETRVAVLENKIVTEIYFDRKKDRGIVGNVYKGKVVKVLPGMQAAFVDIATEKAAFLYVADVTTSMDDYARMLEEGETGSEEESLEFEESSETSVPLMTRPKKGSSQTIEELLQEGQEVVVQVSKEPIGTKGPRVTTYVSLPGRYLVYMPAVNHVGVSRRIGREDERHRLKEMILRLRKPGSGYIVRTVSDGITEEEFKQDIEFLEVVWQNILKKREKSPAPALLHTDLDLIFRTVRDLFTKEVDRLVIDSKQEYERIKEFVGTYIPSFASRVELWDKDEPIFDAYGLEMEISKAKGRRVWLKSGGYIVIDRAEALTVIDVNTGRYVGKRDLEETILKTNLEAVKEIAYQLRLRNIGGIIIIDFIDMEKERNREKVFNAFNEALTSDRARTHILKISELGLVQMSRERTREDILRILCEPCPYCEGRGYTKSPTTICYEIFREIRRIGSSPRDKKIIIGVHPTVANLLYDEERQGVDELEREFHKKIIIKADSNLHIEQYDIVTL
ncbi:MAG TPA: Rne/Rng family ribonuclease [Candidatus Manganitrophaceae bacterium]|nr:Rne/Rng family ribonuclease [Candidatus Manganitrophaceae bacterium]